MRSHSFFVSPAYLTILNIYVGGYIAVRKMKQAQQKI